MTTEKKREVHPIIREALELAHIGAEPVEFSFEALDILRQSLAECFGQPSLFDAVVDLLNLAGILEQEGAHTAALEIIELVATAADALQEVTKRFDISMPKELKTAKKSTSSEEDP
jgi:hypothetical protein